MYKHININRLFLFDTGDSRYKQDKTENYMKLK